MENDMFLNDFVKDYEFSAAAAEDIAFIITTASIVSLNYYCDYALQLSSQL